MHRVVKETRAVIYNIYRLTKVREFDDRDETRALEVHAININRPATSFSAYAFNDGWHTLGYIKNLSERPKIQKMIDEWEKKHPTYQNI